MKIAPGLQWSRLRDANFAVRPGAGRMPPPGGKAATRLRALSVWLALAALIVFDLAFTPGFRSPYVVRSLLFEAAPVVLIGLGQSFAIGTRGIDLSVGSVMALSSAVAGCALGLGQTGAIGLGILAGGACGLFNGVVIAVLRIAPLISSLALLVAVRGLAQALLGGARVDMPLDGPFATLGAATVLGVPVVAMIAGVIACGFAFLIRRTLIGQYAIYAGASRNAAVLAGHPVRATLAFVYTLSGLLAAIAGIFATARLGAADANYIGVRFELDAIAAAVIGGTPLSGGKIAVMGTIAGVLLLTVLDATFIMNNVNANFAQILKAVFIVGALYAQRGRA